MADQGINGRTDGPTNMDHNKAVYTGPESYCFNLNSFDFAFFEKCYMDRWTDRPTDGWPNRLSLFQNCFFAKKNIFVNIDL